MGRSDGYLGLKEVYDLRFGISWLRPIGFNNTYAVMIAKGRFQTPGNNNYQRLVKSR